MFLPWSLLVVACTPEVVLDGGPPRVDTASTVPSPGCDVPCLAPAQSENYASFHRLVVDEDGAAWVSWVETSGPTDRWMYVARSPGPGEPFEPRIQVPVAEPPIVGGSEKPALVVGHGELVVAYTGIGVYRHGDAEVIYRQHAAVDGGDLAFDDPVVVETSPGGRWVMEQPQLAMAPDGEVWLLYKRQDYGVRDVAVWARSSEGFVPDDVSPGLSTDHDCSPPQLQVDTAGRPIASLRNNVGGWLQTALVVGEGAQPQYLTQSSWAYNDAICPEDGPRLAILDEDTWAAVWVEPIPDGTVWRSHYSYSTDGGTTWTDPVFEHDDVGLGERWPTATAVAGRLVTTAERLDGSTRLFERTNPGDAPVETELAGPWGVPLEQVEVAHGGGRTAALGRGEDGVLYLLEL